MELTIRHSRIFKVWRDRVLHDDVWEHGKIRQWCKAVHNLTENGQRSGFATNLTEDEAEARLRYWATPWQDHADMEWRWGHE